jgi:hypothetical protein
LTAFDDETLEDKNSFAVFSLVHGFFVVLESGDGGEAHIDDSFDGWIILAEDFASIVDKELDSSEGLAESAVVLIVKDSWNDLKHFLLMDSHFLSLVDE